MPHSPLIIPSVGKGQEKVIQSTMDACNKVGEEISKLKPETVVIITPHGTMFSDALAISNEDYIKGDFTKFRDFDTYIEGRIDKKFNEELINICKRENIPAVGIDSNILKKFNRQFELDHGAMIPMYFINKYYKDYKIVHVTYAALSDIDLYKFGMAIKESEKKSEVNKTLARLEKKLEDKKEKLSSEKSKEALEKSKKKLLDDFNKEKEATAKKDVNKLVNELMEKQQSKPLAEAMLSGDQEAINKELAEIQNKLGSMSSSELSELSEVLKNAALEMSDEELAEALKNASNSVLDKKLDGESLSKAISKSINNSNGQNSNPRCM